MLSYPQVNFHEHRGHPITMNKTTHIYGCALFLILSVIAVIAYTGTTSKDDQALLQARTGILQQSDVLSPHLITVEDTQKIYDYDFHEAYTYAHRYNLQLAYHFKQMDWVKFYANRWDQYGFDQPDARINEERLYEIMHTADRDALRKFPPNTSLTDN